MVDRRSNPCSRVGRFDGPLDGWNTSIHLKLTSSFPQSNSGSIAAARSETVLLCRSAKRSWPGNHDPTPGTTKNTTKWFPDTFMPLRLCKITVLGFTVFVIPQFFPARHIITSLASPLLMFMATAPHLDDPTTMWRGYLSNSAWAVLTVAVKSSWSRGGLVTSWPRSL